MRLVTFQKKGSENLRAGALIDGDGRSSISLRRTSGVR